MFMQSMKLQNLPFLLLLTISCIAPITAAPENKPQEKTSQQSNKQKYIKAGIVAGTALGIYLLGVWYCKIPKDYSKVSKITVETMKTSYEFAAAGGVGGLKTALSVAESIPVAQQVLYAKVPNPWTWRLFSSLSDDDLPDWTKIEDVMKLHQTTVLKLFIKSPKQQ